MLVVVAVGLNLEMDHMPVVLEVVALAVTLVIVEELLEHQTLEVVVEVEQQDQDLADQV
jgi:hypothetical protein